MPSPIFSRRRRVAAVLNGDHLNITRNDGRWRKRPPRELRVRESGGLRKNGVIEVQSAKRRCSYGAPLLGVAFVGNVVA